MAAVTATRPTSLPGSELGARLREARKALGWTQVHLAHRAGVSQQTVTAIEKGVTLRSRFLPDVAEALQVSERWLRTGEGSGPEALPAESVTPAREIPVLDARALLLKHAEASADRRIALTGDEYEHYGKGSFAVQVGIDEEALVSENGPFRHGDTLLCAPSATPRPGDYAVAAVEGQDAAAFGQLRLRQDRCWELVPLNSMYPVCVLGDEDRVIGVVREIRHPIR